MESGKPVAHNVPVDVRPIPADANILCPSCGYDLRSISSDKCPECGLAIDREAPAVSRIPWQHRRQIGRFRGFWRTTILVIFHPRRFAEEMNRPVDYRGARSFQLICVTLGWVALFGWALAGILTDVHPKLTGPGRLGWILETLVIVSICLAIWLYLWLASGVPSYWFHPRDLSVSRQNRAIAISYYASAPLAWLWLPSLILLAWVLIDSASPHGILGQLELALPLLAGIITSALFIYDYLLILHLMRATTHCSASRTVAMGLLLPVTWYACLALCADIPAIVIYLSLVILSFR